MRKTLFDGDIQKRHHEKKARKIRLLFHPFVSFLPRFTDIRVPTRSQRRCLSRTLVRSVMYHRRSHVGMRPEPNLKSRSLSKSAAQASHAKSRILQRRSNWHSKGTAMQDKMGRKEAEDGGVDSPRGRRMLRDVGSGEGFLKARVGLWQVRTCVRAVDVLSLARG